MPSVNFSNQLNKFVNSKYIEKNVFKFAKENPAGFAARMALISAISKDAVNCYYYTTQSWNNKKIPADKRGFVGSMDLMNGILNVVGQLIIGSWIEKQAPKWGSSLIEKRLDALQIRKISSDLAKQIGDPEITQKKIAKYLDKNKVLGATGSKAKWLSVGFSALVTLLGTQVFCKRVLTPFLATPLAGWFSKIREQKIAAKKAGNHADKASTDMDKTTVKQQDKIVDNINPAFSKFQNK